MAGSGTAERGGPPAINRTRRGPGSLGVIGSTILSSIALAGAIFGIVALVWVASRGHGEREDEEAARVFYDAHGRWPDD